MAVFRDFRNLSYSQNIICLKTNLIIRYRSIQRNLHAISLAQLQSRLTFTLLGRQYRSAFHLCRMARAILVM